MVKTGDEKHAGTDNFIQLEIVGDKERTEKHELTKWWKDCHERDSTFEMTLKDKDVGVFEYVIKFHN